MASIGLTATAVSFSTRATRRLGTAGAAIAIGQCVYMDTSDGKWKVAQATIADIEDVPASLFGICASSADADGQDIVVVTADPDMTTGVTETVGEQRYVSSATGGEYELEADLATGDAVILMYVPTSTSKAILNPIVGGEIA